MSNATADLTIVTVAGPADEVFIGLNISAIRAKNSDCDIPIYVIDNGKFAAIPDGIKGSMDCELLDGVMQDMNLPSHYRGSYQHGAALNNFFKTTKIKSRYVLIIDPDFYVIKENWIEDVIDTMQRENLAFFGAPWHPRWYSKYRYFPCVHFMCIDAARIDVSSLDFAPALKVRDVTETRAGMVVNILRPFYIFTLQRLKIGHSKDTGYNIFSRYYTLKKVGLLNPVMAIDKNFVALRMLRLRIVQIVEKIIPDRYSYLPKNNGYYSELGFAESGLKDISALGWEEFMWKNMPFAFHLRRFIKKERDVQAELAIIKEILK